MAGTSLAQAGSALLLMVFLIEASHALDPARSAPSSVEYWQMVLPSFPLPVELVKRVSPLESSAASVTHYTQMMSSTRRAPGVRQGMSSLCMAGRLYCSSPQFAAFRTVYPKCTIQIRFRTYHFAAQQLNQGSFFRESDLVEGALLVLTDQKDRTPSAPFLPRQLADKLHPADATLLQAAFGIPPSSLLSKESIQTSQSLCKAAAEDLLPGEQAFCAYSLEDLADELKTRVVTDASSTSLKLLPVSSSSARTHVQARLLKVKLEAEADQPYLSCHAETYPFAVYFCHHIPNTRIYSATFQATHASSSETVSAVAICHLDTSNWSPQHIAFVDLNTTPGRTEACHWTHENSLIFVASNS